MLGAEITEQPLSETIAPSKLTNEPHLQIAARPKDFNHQYPFSQSLPTNVEKSGAKQFLPSSDGTLYALEELGSPSTISTGSPITSCSEQRRDAHMASEQRRRADMRNCFGRLQQLLPPSEYRKPSKANLLQAAVNYIVHLKRQEKILQTKVQFLLRENAILSQQIHGTTNPCVVAQKDENLPIAPASRLNLRQLNQ
ncbi:hypothetical protein PSACC_03492 [Paramicrosporidium saccamoebae]|uniref:BHLH domain-containing protein n=1 Tax=Paramicrosporidium saccamoebae TaxID=1246581 RepID=A0A2H9TG13_9FUNG|nr:hypothetical protein PSACC_03492 [Paramicrosporidium saccamoebae]